MNTVKRFLLGVLSSSLLAAGFVQAANVLDPMTSVLGTQGDNTVVSAAAASCNDPCAIVTPN